MKKITLNVEGLHCKSCEMLVADSLEDHDGVDSAKLDHKKGTASIKFDETKVNPDSLRSIIKKEGYKVV